MKVKVVLIPVFLAKRLRDLRRAVADSHQLHAQHVELVRLLRAEKVRDAKPAAPFLTGEPEAQPLTRRTVWGAVKRRPAAIPSYQEASQLPQLPRPLVRLVAPGVIAIERALHGASDDAIRADLRALPEHLDRVDGWIVDGVLGGAKEPNAADLQIGSSLRLLTTIGDVRPLLAGRPGEALATALFADFPGDVPAGAYPAGWLPVARAS